jgi:hypothetical protein
VFVDQGGASKELLRYPHAEVTVFSIQNGWDFSKMKIIEEFLDLLDAEKPDEVFFAPPCHLWCPWQRAHAKFTPGYAEKLEKLRLTERKTSLTMVKTGYVQQRYAGLMLMSSNLYLQLHGRRLNLAVYQAMMRSLLNAAKEQWP